MSKELNQKSTHELLELFDQSPYVTITKDTILTGSTLTPKIENDIEQVIIDRTSSLSTDELLQYQFVKLKRSYNSGYFAHDKELGKKTRDIRINVLTGYNTEKTNAVNIIISSINKDLHENLLNTKHDDTYIDLFFYNKYNYWNPNDTKFVFNKSVFLFESDPQNHIKTEKEYQDAIKRNALIQKRQFKTKLHSFIRKIITEYEENKGDVFTDFNDLYEAIYEWINNKYRKKSKQNHKCGLLPQRLSSPSAIGYESALTPFPGNFIVSNEKEAHLRILTPETLDGIRKDSIDLQILSTRNFRNDVGNRDYNLLNAIYTLIYHGLYTKNIEKDFPGYIVFYEQDLAKLIGMDVRGKRKGSLIRELAEQFDDLIGQFKDRSYYKLFTLNYFNIETGEVHAYVGYFDALKKILDEKHRNLPKPKSTHSKKKYIKPSITHTHLVHSKIHSKIKTKHAIEAVIYITTKIQQAGSTINKGKLYKEICINPKTIINAVPQLKESLDNAGLTKSPTQSKNNILKRVFSSVYIGLEKYTDLSKYYIDFSFSKIIPTVSMLEKPMTFQHKGQNRSYELPQKH